MITRRFPLRQHGGLMYLCEECHRDLLAFVGVRPDTDELWRLPEPDIAPRPFSACGDERLELS